MSSSCMSSGGGGRAYRLEALDLDIIKSPSSTSWISNSPSPSSTLSESSNGPTRKPRTPRKRPNQKYNEAAAILSTAYPKIFPTAKPCKFTHSHDHSLFEPSSELLMPFQEVDCSGFLQLDSRPDFSVEIKNSCRSSGEINCVGEEEEEEEEEEFDAESILDEEMGEGIESIMGNIFEMDNQPFQPHNNNNTTTFCYGYPVGYGMIKESRAMRNVDQCDWWSFPSVNVIDVNPNFANVSSETKKKMKVETNINITNSPNAGLLLKLNYDSILHDWSDKASPFSGDSPAADSAGNDVRARLAQIDLFCDNGGLREASVLRYKEKRRTRLFSKKIRYEVRKVNADRRPRMKGRFVRTPNSSDD